MSFDMGGTTAKACLIEGPQTAGVRQFSKSTGCTGSARAAACPSPVPSIDMIEIGAGGGSIASVDDLGLSKGGATQRRFQSLGRPATAAAA